MLTPPVPASLLLVPALPVEFVPPVLELAPAVVLAPPFITLELPLLFAPEELAMLLLLELHAGLAATNNPSEPSNIDETEAEPRRIKGPPNNTWGDSSVALLKLSPLSGSVCSNHLPRFDKYL
jgi:hypothetical protein